MRTLYRDVQSGNAPGCLQRPNGRIIESNFGIEKDVQQDRAAAGMLATIPGQGLPDVLPYIGDERVLPRAVGESDADYAERMRTTWDAPSGWSFAGSWGGMLFALARAGFPMGTATGVNIVQRYARYGYLASGVVTFGTHPPMMFDGGPASVFSQFMIVIGADFTPPVGSVFHDGDPSADLLNGLIDQWKPAKWRFMGTVVVLSGLLWGWPPSTLWNSSGTTWGGASSRFVMPF